MRWRNGCAGMVMLIIMLVAPAAADDPGPVNEAGAEELIEPGPPPPMTVLDGLLKFGAGAMTSASGNLIVTRSRGRAFAHVELAPARRTVLGPAMAAKAGPGEVAADIPSEFALGRSVPNPSRGLTTIGFDLPVASRVRLAVFDLQGRQVRSLADGEFAAGRHSRTWSAGDGPRERLAPGIYFARLDAQATSGASRFTKVEKLILME